MKPFAMILVALAAMTVNSAAVADEGEFPPGLSPEQKGRLEKKLENMTPGERWCFEERRKAMKERRRNMSEEDKASIRDRRQAMRERRENMSEEERETFRERKHEMRKKFRNMSPDERRRYFLDGPPGRGNQGRD